MLTITHLQADHLTNPIGIDNPTPRLSWQIESSMQNVMQQSYRIEASHDADFSEIIWDSGIVDTDQSLWIPYGGKPCISAERVYWRVTVTAGGESVTSNPAWFEMGLLKKEDFSAQWIEPEHGNLDTTAIYPASYFRKEFVVEPGLVSARAYFTAHGLYELHLNGQKCSDQFYTPGFTAYTKRLQVQTYDVTSYLKEGENALGAILGNGWWRGGPGGCYKYGYYTGLFGQLVLTYTDGHQDVIATDRSFLTSYGPIRENDLKSGETYDARLEMPGWDKPGFAAQGWHAPFVGYYPLENLIGTNGVPMRVVDRLTPTVVRTPDGNAVLDFGVNINGMLRFTVQGPVGERLDIRLGEALDRDGNFYISRFPMPPKNDDGDSKDKAPNMMLMELTRDMQCMHFTLSGRLDDYTPTFMSAGFRYALVENYDCLSVAKFEALVINSDCEITGSFSCSNPQITQIAENTLRSQMGNFLDIPTDCPTRERNGWTGDAQIFAATGAMFMDIYAFMEKWMADVAAEQHHSGEVPSIVPNPLAYHNVKEFLKMWDAYAGRPMLMHAIPGELGGRDGSVGWGDATVIIPWVMYQAYGDTEILRRQYDSGRAWVEYMIERAKVRNEDPRYHDRPYYDSYQDGECDGDYIWDSNFHWGEWLETFPQKKMNAQGVEEENGMGYGDPMIATSYLAYSSALLARIAAILGKELDAAYYAAYSARVKKAINRCLIEDDGTIIEDHQAPNVRTLAFDLADDAHRSQVAVKLHEMVVANDYHLNTGFLATPFLLPVLVDAGYTEDAFRILAQKKSPSWLYAIEKGATTIWESWEAVTPEGDIHGSLNHYSKGAVSSFLFNYVAGIRLDENNPGWKHFFIKPVLGGGLTEASAKFNSPYGEIVSSWIANGGLVSYSFMVPANTTATALLPCTFESAQADGLAYEDGCAVIEYGSGQYEITLEQ